MRARLVLVVVVAVALLGACRPIVVPGDTDPDSLTQFDLRKALDAENTYFASYGQYARIADVQAIDPSVNWPAIWVQLDAHQEVVCIQEHSSSGTTFAILHIRFRVNAGTYYARTSCPGPVSDFVVPAGFTDTGW